jgi:predicted outer membrane repeat protein
MQPLKILLAALFVASLALPASARTWRIRADGLGDVPTINDAVLACQDGDSILVAPGTYTWINQDTQPNDQYTMIWFKRGLENVVIVSEAGPLATVIDAQYQGRVLVTEGQNYLTVDGFTLRGGRAPSLGLPIGGCMILHVSHDTFRNCIFTDNSASTGGVAWVGGLAEPRFMDCEFMYNNANVGGALFIVNSETPVTIQRCRFHHNTADTGGGALYMVHILVTVEDCVFAFNQAPQGGAIFMRSMWAATVVGCTLVRNGGSEAGAFYVLASPGVSIARSIVSYGGEGTPYYVASNSAVTVSCTNTFHNPFTNDLPATVIDGGGNFTADPAFCGSVDSMNYMLALSSPCLPGNHPDGASCGQIGAYGQGCAPVSVHERTWGQIKAMYQ